MPSESDKLKNPTLPKCDACEVCTCLGVPMENERTTVPVGVPMENDLGGTVGMQDTKGVPMENTKTKETSKEFERVTAGKTFVDHKYLESLDVAEGSIVVCMDNISAPWFTVGKEYRVYKIRLLDGSFVPALQDNRGYLCVPSARFVRKIDIDKR